MAGRKATDTQAAQKAIADELFRAKNGPYEEGDVVKLKSGGPLMTVSKHVGDLPANVNEGDLLCLYFAGDQIRSLYFPPEMVVGVPQSASE